MDTVKRLLQLVLALMECTLSFTLSLLLGDEGYISLHNGLIQPCIQMHPLDSPHIVIRNDSAPGFKALVENKLLANHQITLEIAQPKNRTKNPVAEKAVLEPKQKMLHQGPSGGPVTDLAIAMATLNS